MDWNPILKPFTRAIRHCPNPDWCSYVHTWEIINPRNSKAFRRGRVVFFCDRHMPEPIPTIERMRMLRR